MPDIYFAICVIFLIACLWLICAPEIYGLNRGYTRRLWRWIKSVLRCCVDWYKIQRDFRALDRSLRRCQKKLPGCRNAEYDAGYAKGYDDAVEDYENSNWISP